jgi:hypothetical protein
MNNARCAVRGKEYRADRGDAGQCAARRMDAIVNGYGYCFRVVRTLCNRNPSG